MSPVFLVLAIAAPPTAVFAPASDDGSWFQARVEAVMAEQLRAAGLVVRPSTTLSGRGPQEVTIRIDSKPARVERGTTSIVLRTRMSGAKKGATQVKGPAAELDRLVAALSTYAARTIAGVDLQEVAMTTAPLPFGVHRQLGRATVRLRQGQVRQAMLAFDQAGRRARVGPLPAAIRGRRRAFQQLVHEKSASLGPRGDLATASLERAEVAARQGDAASARRAWQGFLRYTDAYAQRWWLPAGLRRGARVYAAKDRYVLAADGQRWRFDPQTGMVAKGMATRAGLVNVLGNETLHLTGRVLSRRTGDGKIRWQFGLPLGPHWARSTSSRAIETSVFTTSGFVGVLGADTVLWADAALGHVGQVSRLTPPIAASTGGVLVRLPSATDESRIGLLRPGKQTPAWQVSLPKIRQAMLSRERVVVVSEAGLHLLRTHNGKATRTVRPWPAGAEWLHVSGRYGTARLPDGRVALYDVLSGRETGRRAGPGRPMDAITLTEGVAVLFATGDVFQLDRDGHVLDRARPPGRPLQLLAGHPLTPGPIVVTTEGVFGLTELRAGLVRDVDAYLALSELLGASGQSAAALRLATAVAIDSAGRVADAERLRARWLRALGNTAAARSATRRADTAADLSKSLPPPAISAARR